MDSIQGHNIFLKKMLLTLEYYCNPSYNCGVSNKQSIMKGNEKITLELDLGPFESLIKREINSLRESLEKSQSDKSTNQNDLTVDWITSKKWMGTVDMKSYTSFYTVLDRMPDDMKTKVGGRIYVHKDTIRKYFEGAYTDQK